MNVAITRARRGVHGVGDAGTLAQGLLEASQLARGAVFGRAQAVARTEAPLQVAGRQADRAGELLLEMGGTVAGAPGEIGQRGRFRF